jgi:ubiquinone/menaquinone biosynthesis C-methylase UbiE
MKKIINIVLNELILTIRNPFRVFRLLKINNVRQFLKKIQGDFKVGRIGDGDKTAWVNWSKFDTMEKSYRNDHNSHKVIQDWIKSKTSKRGFSFLDCGILSCVTYKKLKENNRKVDYTGIDINENIVENCRERYQDQTWKSMSVEKLKFSKNSFDIVQIRHVLEHLNYYDKAVIEASRVTKKFAIFCLFFPLEDRDSLEYKKTKDGIYHMNKYGKDDFMKLLKERFNKVDVVYVQDDQRDNQVFFCEK